MWKFWHWILVLVILNKQQKTLLFADNKVNRFDDTYFVCELFAKLNTNKEWQIKSVRCCSIEHLVCKPSLTMFKLCLHFTENKCIRQHFSAIFGRQKTTVWRVSNRGFLSFFVCHPAAVKGCKINWRQELPRPPQTRGYTTISVPCCACGEWRGRPLTVRRMWINH